MLKASLLAVFASCPLIAEAAVMQASYEGIVTDLYINNVDFFGGEDPIGQPFWAEFIYDTDNGVVENGPTGQFLHQGGTYGNGAPGTFTARSEATTLTRQGNEALDVLFQPAGYRGIPQLSHNGLSVIGSESIGLLFLTEISGAVPMSFDAPWSGDVLSSNLDGILTWMTLTDDGPNLELWFNVSVTRLTISPAPAPVPLPPALPLLGASLLVLAKLRRRDGRA